MIVHEDFIQDLKYTINLLTQVKELVIIILGTISWPVNLVKVCFKLLSKEFTASVYLSSDNAVFILLIASFSNSFEVAYESLTQAGEPKASPGTSAT